LGIDNLKRKVGDPGTASNKRCWGLVHWEAGMPKKIPAEDKRQAVIFTTLRQNEREQVEKHAEAAGLSLSSAVRRMILRDLQRGRELVRQAS
jgi:hypothetical protein